MNKGEEDDTSCWNSGIPAVLSNLVCSMQEEKLANMAA
jgi:hypothetical protein